MYTSTTVHNVHAVRAHTTFSMGAPLILTLTDNNGHSSTVTIFIGDQIMANRLVTAINLAALSQQAMEEESDTFKEGDRSIVEKEDDDAAV